MRTIDDSQMSQHAEFIAERTFVRRGFMACEQLFAGGGYFYIRHQLPGRWVQEIWNDECLAWLRGFALNLEVEPKSWLSRRGESWLHEMGLSIENPEGWAQVKTKIYEVSASCCPDPEFIHARNPERAAELWAASLQQDPDGIPEEFLGAVVTVKFAGEIKFEARLSDCLDPNRDFWKARDELVHVPIAEPKEYIPQKGEIAMTTLYQVSDCYSTCPRFVYAGTPERAAQLYVRSLAQDPEGFPDDLLEAVVSVKHGRDLVYQCEASDVLETQSDPRRACLSAAVRGTPGPEQEPKRDFKAMNLFDCVVASVKASTLEEAKRELSDLYARNPDWWGKDCGSWPVSIVDTQDGSVHEHDFHASQYTGAGQ